MTEKLEKTLQELNNLMKEVNDLKRQKIQMKTLV